MKKPISILIAAAFMGMSFSASAAVAPPISKQVCDMAMVKAFEALLKKDPSKLTEEEKCMIQAYHLLMFPSCLGDALQKRFEETAKMVGGGNCPAAPKQDPHILPENQLPIPPELP